MKYRHAFVAFLAFFWGATIFANAAAILSGNHSSKALTVRVVPPGGRVGGGSGGAGGAGGAGRGGTGGEHTGPPVAPGGSGGAGEGTHLVGGSLVGPRPAGGPRTIGQANLERSEQSAMKTPEWMESFVQKTDEWRTFLIKTPGRRSEEVASYWVNTEKQAYITNFAHTKDLKTINLDMKYRDILLDNYRSASGDQTNLKIIGTKDIMEPEARKSITDALRDEGKDILAMGKSSVEFTPNSAGWNSLIMNRNPFTEGQMKLLPSLSDGGRTASIEKFTVIISGDNELPTIHMITHFVYH